MQGECRNNVCVCTPGYRGDYCEINPSCSGLLDVNGNCCPDGVVSASGVCCGDVSLSPMQMLSLPSFRTSKYETLLSKGLA